MGETASVPHPRPRSHTVTALLASIGAYLFAFGAFATQVFRKLSTDFGVAHSPSARIIGSSLLWCVLGVALVGSVLASRLLGARLSTTHARRLRLATVALALLALLGHILAVYLGVPGPQMYAR